MIQAQNSEIGDQQRRVPAQGCGEPRLFAIQERLAVRQAFCVLLAMLLMLLVGGCEELGLVGPFGGEEQPAEREARYRVIVDLEAPDLDEGTDEISLSITLGGEAEAPDGTALPDTEPITEQSYRLSFEGAIDHGQYKLLYLHAEADNGPEDFTMRVRYFDIGGDPEAELHDETRGARNGLVQFALSIPF